MNCTLEAGSAHRHRAAGPSFSSCMLDCDFLIQPGTQRPRQRWTKSHVGRAVTDRQCILRAPQAFGQSRSPACPGRSGPGPNTRVRLLLSALCNRTQLPGLDKPPVAASDRCTVVRFGSTALPWIAPPIRPVLTKLGRRGSKLLPKRKGERAWAFVPALARNELHRTPPAQEFKGLRKPDAATPDRKAHSKFFYA